MNTERQRTSSFSHSVPFGMHTTSTSWMPHTPRDAPYIEHFQPTPKDKWMTGLRVETAKQNRIDFYSAKAAEGDTRNRYSNQKGKPSSAQLAKRQRFMKLLNGGDVPSLLEPPKQMKDGQILRGCRLYGEEKPPIPAFSPHRSGNKTPGEKNGEQGKKN
jgi:hypothetical protein